MREITDTNEFLFLGLVTVLGLLVMIGLVFVAYDLLKEKRDDDT